MKIQTKKKPLSINPHASEQPTWALPCALTAFQVQVPLHYHSCSIKYALNSGCAMVLKPSSFANPF